MRAENRRHIQMAMFLNCCNMSRASEINSCVRGITRRQISGILDILTGSVLVTNNTSRCKHPYTRRGMVEPNSGWRPGNPESLRRRCALVRCARWEHHRTEPFNYNKPATPATKACQNFRILVLVCHTSFTPHPWTHSHLGTLVISPKKAHPRPVPCSSPFAARLLQLHLCARSPLHRAAVLYRRLHPFLRIPTGGGQRHGREQSFQGTPCCFAVRMKLSGPHGVLSSSSPT